MAGDGRSPPPGNRPRPPSSQPTGDERPFDTWLNRQLHAMYDEIAREPLPAELVKLIERDGRQAAEAPGDGTNAPTPPVDRAHRNDD